MKRLALLLLVGCHDGDDEPAPEETVLASAIVGAEGGVVEGTTPEFAGTRIELPPLDQPTLITILRVGTAFEFRPVDLVVDAFVRITIRYEENGGLQVQPVRLDGNEPVFREFQEIDRRLLTFRTRRLGRFTAE